MNTDDRRSVLLDKANSLIDKIQDAMRLVENTESAKKKFLRPDSMLSLEIPVEGEPDLNDVFKINEIFDEKGIEKIKAFILMELETLEETNLKLLEAAGFVEQRQDIVPQEPEVKEPPEAAGSEDWENIAADPEDDSDMKIVIPNKIAEVKADHSRKKLSNDKIEEIQKLSRTDMKPQAIADKVGVSYNSVIRYSSKYMETIPKKLLEGSGRSASKR